MRLYNTLTRREEDFAPSRDNTVRMYTCGLTVYNRGHIGNFRTFVCIDVLRRTLKYLCGFGMHQVMNFTDVDDRTIAGAQHAGMPLREYTDQFIAAFREDAAALGLEPVEEMPRATDEANLRAMVEMIQALDARGHTYRSEGSIYYRIATFPSTASSRGSIKTASSPGRASTAIITARKTRATSCCGRRPGPTSRRGITASAPGVRAGTSSARRWPSGCSARRRSMCMGAGWT